MHTQYKRFNRYKKISRLLKTKYKENHELCLLFFRIETNQKQNSNFYSIPVGAPPKYATQHIIPKVNYSLKITYQVHLFQHVGNLS